MDATRLRVGSVSDWIVAAVFLVATVGVGLLIVREMTAIDRPVVAQPPVAAPEVVPAGLPPLSIPVPSLKLPGAGELRLGDTLDKVSSALGRQAETGVQVIDQGRLGPRMTRGYEFAKIRFTIVFEPFERNGEFRIVGIYVQ